MHPLQTTFATAEGETAWCETLRELIGAARFAEAEAILAPAVAELNTDIGELCRMTTADMVSVSGWPELAERIELHEGEEPITGLTVAIGNDGDLAFEKGRLHTPYMMLGLYSDEAWTWSGASREVLLAECTSESPPWAGTDEDLEAFLYITGLDPLNTALIHSKQRHFIREGAETHAPLRYVEFLVGCWWRALRFHQAVARAESGHPLPGAITIVSGMVDMRPDVVAVHLPERQQPPAAAPAPAAARPVLVMAEADPFEDEMCDEEAEEEAVPDLISPSMITRKPIVEDKPLSGADLRRRVVVEAANDAAPTSSRPGFIARLFGRA